MHCDFSTVFIHRRIYLCILCAFFPLFFDSLHAVFLKWQAGHCDIIIHNAACWGSIPKPPNRMINHAAARFFKTLIAPFGCRRGTAETIISHGSDSFLSGRRALHFKYYPKSRS